MTTSNSTDFTLDAGQIIDESFSLLGVKIAAVDLQSEQIQDGLNALNLMLKGWQAQGLHLWTEEEGIIFLDVGKENYLLGPTGDEATTIDDFVGTTITSTLAADVVIIPVVSSTGMLAGDFVGIQLDDKTRHWTTIFSVDTSTQITLTVKLPTQAISGNTAFTFTKLIERPLRISSSRRKTFAQDNEIPVESWSRNEYFKQVNKSSQGTVVNSYYSPLLNNGRYYVWQTAASVNDLVRFSFERSIQDIDLSSETLDIPVEWLETVIYNLAVRLANTYSAPPQRIQLIVAEAAFFLDQLLGWDEEIESLNVQPDFS